MVDVSAALREHCDGRPEIVAAYLFGSTARGAARATSDVDVALVLDTSVPREEYLSYRLDFMAALEAKIGRPIDVVLMNEASPLLRFEVFRSGRRLMSRDPALVRELTARAMLDWFDYQPIFERITGAAIERLRARARG